MFGAHPPDWATGIPTEPETVEVLAPTRSLRLFADTEAGALREWLKQPTSGGKQFFITDPGNLSAQSIALRITSAEMRAKPPVAGEREILPGDTAIIDTEQPHVRPGDTVALLVESDPDIHLRKAMMRGAGKMVFMALNSDQWRIRRRRGRWARDVGDGGNVNPRIGRK